ncbi:T9SS type A sorting domain-containing protein [Flavobacterium sp.]|uniref:T9SS type A sorting domain-containing protein n=1 Tax=Flavobacterium sp. TaxID=239 RepID=UPI00286DB3B6|nr:T9SS type A sorting domain-containing protein [Flavobacterium sp.]
MSKLLLIVVYCFFNVMYSQQVIDLRLVKGETGRPVVNSNFGVTKLSNDDGLNAILQTNNVTRYDFKGGHPYSLYADKMIEITCNCDENKLVNDLNFYSMVVDKAVVSNYGSFTDALLVGILKEGLGIPIGVHNSIVTTNDDGLNQIFRDFKVFYYDRWCTTCGNSPIIAKAYSVVCDCDNKELNIALNNYKSVIEISEYASAFYYLGNDSFFNSIETIYPNPFSTSFTINTTENILEYSIFDVSGKQIIKSNSKSDLDKQTSKLVSGIYFLKLQFENGKNGSYKLIKK